MTEAMSGLIQMTAHDVVTSEARAMIVWGCVLAAVCAVLAVAGAIVAGSGAGQPRQKLLYCCASGPVSLEAVATVYDIVGVDGKMLTLAERQGG